MRIIAESEFASAIAKLLTEYVGQFDFVTGPGRSGAVASVYASHILRIPFIPAGTAPPSECKRLLVIDTAVESGKTLRKCARRYAAHNPITIAVYHEPPRVAFWYEAQKPQRYAHERKAA